MITSEQATKRLEQLDIRIKAILGNPKEIDPKHADRHAEAKALVIATGSLFEKLFESPSLYAKAFAKISISESSHNDLWNRAQLEMLRSIVGDVRDEIGLGLLANFESQVQAGIFEEFIDYADAFLTLKRKNEAGVIAGVTFEDTIRKLCLKNKIAEKSRRLEDLISDLARGDILNALEAKRSRVGAHVRTKATHAQWDEFDESAVREVIEFIRGTLLLRLAS